MFSPHTSGRLIPTAEGLNRTVYLNNVANQVYFFFTVDSHLDIRHHGMRLVLSPNGTGRALLLRLQWPVQSPHINSFHHLWDDVERSFYTWYDFNNFRNPCPDEFSASQKRCNTQMHSINCVVKTQGTCLHIRLPMTGDLAGWQWRISLLRVKMPPKMRSEESLMLHVSKILWGV